MTICQGISSWWDCLLYLCILFIMVFSPQWALFIPISNQQRPNELLDYNKCCKRHFALCKVHLYLLFLHLLSPLLHLFSWLFKVSIDYFLLMQSQERGAVLRQRASVPFLHHAVVLLKWRDHHQAELRPGLWSRLLEHPKEGWLVSHGIIFIAHMFLHKCSSLSIYIMLVNLRANRANPVALARYTFVCVCVSEELML